mmetsp:Transcript_16342/g.48998  ORF Transcript_16342/g.48998 Transcript_16342/m.48998 type:complete len:324 (+) Transcript_16342:1185-2156(+)
MQQHTCTEWAAPAALELTAWRSQLPALLSSSAFMSSLPMLQAVRSSPCQSTYLRSCITAAPVPRVAQQLAPGSPVKHPSTTGHRQIGALQGTVLPTSQLPAHSVLRLCGRGSRISTPRVLTKMEQTTKTSMIMRILRSTMTVMTLVNMMNSVSMTSLIMTMFRIVMSWRLRSVPCTMRAVCRKTSRAANSDHQQRPPRWPHPGREPAGVSVQQPSQPGQTRSRLQILKLLAFRLLGASWGSRSGTEPSVTIQSHRIRHRSPQPQRHSRCCRSSSSHAGPHQCTSHRQHTVRDPVRKFLTSQRWNLPLGLMPRLGVERRTPKWP